MGNTSNSNGCTLRLAMAVLALASGIAVETSWAATWNVINTGIPAAEVEVGALVIAPKTPSTIYAITRSATGAGGLFKTTDGAQSWKAISSVVGASSVFVD